MLSEEALGNTGEQILVRATDTCALIARIGSPDFVEALMRFGQDTVDANFVSVFCLGDRDAPLLIGTATTVARKRAELAAKGHERHHDEDRNSSLLTEKRTPVDILTIQTAQSVTSFPYRRDCYDRPGIADRISLIRRRRDYGLAVSLYRATENGPFPEEARIPVTASLRIMITASERHIAYTLKGKVWKLNDVQVRLALAYPTLTDREREVAAMTIKGRTATEIAKMLGLAETTIITHRKKAYRRMNVANLRELMASFNG